MQCEEVRDQLADYLRGELPPSSRADLLQHLESCGSCRAEVAGIEDVWQRLGDIPSEPVPVEAMRARFEQLLEPYRQGLEDRLGRSASSAHAVSPHQAWWSRTLQAAAAAAVLLVGVATGRLLQPQVTQPADLADLRRELRDVRQMLTLSLMQQQSAAERLRGVNGSSQIDQPGEEIISALLDALQHDASVNVRLAAVDALRRFSEQEVVRRRTVEALSANSFPLLQVALIDFVVETRDMDAVAALRRLSEDASVNDSVRDRARWALERLRS